MSQWRRYLKELMIEKSLFIKVQIFILLVLFLSTAVIGFAYDSNAEEHLVSTYSEACENSLKMTGVSIDMMIDSIMDISGQVYNDIMLNDLFTKGSVDSYPELNALQKRITQICFSNRNIHSVYLYIEKLDVVMSTTTGLCELDRFDDKFFMEWYKRDDLPVNYVVGTHPVANNNGASSTVEHVFSVFRRIPLPGTIDKVKGALIINMKQSAVYDGIIGKLRTNRENPFFIVDENDLVILTHNEKDLYKSVYFFPFIYRELSGQSGSYVTRMDGVRYLVVYNTAGSRQWKYASLYPFEGIYGMVGKIKTFVILISAMIIFLCLLISAFFTVRFVKPIEEMSSFLGREGERRIRGKNQLQRIKEKVFDISRINEEMKEKLELTIPVFREKFIYNLIKGNYSTRKEIDTKLDAFSIALSQEGLVLSIVQIDDYEERIASEAYDDNLIKFSIIHTVTDFFKGRGMQSYCVETSPENLAVILDKKDVRMAELLNHFETLQKIILQQTQVSVTIGVCDAETGIAGLKDSYEKAMEVLKYKILYGKMQILLYSDIRQDDGSSYAYPYKKVELLKTLVKVCDRDTAVSVLDEILGEISKNQSYLLVQHLVIQLNSSLIELVNEVNLPLGLVFEGVNLLENLQKIQSLPDVRRYFTSIIDKIVQQVQSGRKSKMDKYYDRIMEYLTENYMRELTLEIVSGDIQLSPTYINQILRSKSGKTFVQLLNEMRIEKANELLRDSDMKVKDIAEQVGFTSSKYFIKIYKEIVGVTPGKYKENM